MGAFGVSTLTLRTPAIIGAVIYVLSALWICWSLSRQMIVRLPLFVCLVFNPMILDYLVAARGYSLAMGFLLAAIAVVASIVLAPDSLDRTIPSGKCVLISVLLALSFASNFSFALADGSVGVLFFACAATRQPSSVRAVLRLATISFLPGIAVAAAICGLILWRFPRSQLDFGSQSLSEMWNGLISASFDNAHSEIPGPTLISILSAIRPILPYVCVMAMLALVFAAEVNHRRSNDDHARRLLTFMRFLIGVASATLLAHWTMFQATHIPLPKDRTGIFFVLFLDADIWLGTHLGTSIRSRNHHRDIRHRSPHRDRTVFRRMPQIHLLQGMAL
jgi:hypothetical protein